jgi:hypothetical protein
LIDPFTPTAVLASSRNTSFKSLLSRTTQNRFWYSLLHTAHLKSNSYHRKYPLTDNSINSITCAMAPRKTSDELVLGHCEFCQDDLKLSNREDFCLCQGYLCREPVPKEYQESNKQYIICKDCVQPVIGSTRAFCPECRFIQKFGKWGDGGFHTTRTGT